MIKMIWAMDRDYLIGKDNLLPWHYPLDLAYFKKQTVNRSVLMGEATYLSLKGYYKEKKLPFGNIFICSLHNDYSEGVMVRDIDGFLRDYQDDIMVIGGKTIYELALPYAKQLHVTHIDGSHEGNVYLRKDILAGFKLVSKKQEGNLSFCIYER